MNDITRTKDYSVARRRMVEEQLQGAGVTDARVLAAMGEVPRHRFIPGQLAHRAYRPSALPIGYGQTISKPFTVGLMTALMELSGDEHILEIGTGSGYQAAILARLTRSVVSVERIVPLADRARSILEDLNCTNVTVLSADGSNGNLELAPYDAIVVTACASGLPRELIRQLRDGGKLLVPLQEDGGQVIYRYQRRGTDLGVERSVACGFVPLVAGVEEGRQRAAQAGAAEVGEERPRA